MGNKEPRPALRVIDVIGPIKFARWLLRHPVPDHDPFAENSRGYPNYLDDGSRLVIVPVEGLRFHPDDVAGFTSDDIIKDLDSLMSRPVIHPTPPVTLEISAENR